MDEPINFVESAFNSLSPFSAHRIEVRGEIFPTVEHAYQALRIKPGPEHETIKNAPSPWDAWKEGQKHKNDPAVAVPNVDKYALMEELFRLKIAQHPDVLHILKKTGVRGLLKVHALDYDWGTGADGSGKNMMGKIWMKIREEIL